MAIVKNNLALTGVSGSVGNLTVSQRNGKTVLSAKRGRQTTPLTDQQLEVQARFKRASTYATTVCKDPEIKEEYQQAARPGQTAYSVAMRDALNGPEVLDISRFDDSLIIEAIDDFKVKSVKVEIFENEELIEEGRASLLASGIYWQYDLTTKRSRIPGVKIVVIVMDMPGNITEAEIIM